MYEITRRSLTPFLVLSASVVLFLGCSSGGHHDSPVETSTTLSPSDFTESLAPAGDSRHVCLWYCLIDFDLTDRTDPRYEVIPFRLGMMHMNVLRFLETSPCTDCFSIERLQFTQPDVLNFDVRLRHPFDNLDFTVFDVRGIIMFDGTHLFPESGLTVADPAMGDCGLLNADGYTALYNGSTMGMAEPLYTYHPGRLSSTEIPNSDVNGYIRFRDIYTRNVFPAGSGSRETYTIKIADSSHIVVGYAVDASWAEPINRPVVDPETDFGSNANCTEAWRIKVADLGPGLTTVGGSTNLRISIYDWQAFDDAYPVLLECPDLFDGQLQAQLTSAGDNKSTYEIVIENARLAGEGEHLLLVRKEAFENDPDNQPWLDLTAYQVVKIAVKEEHGQPVEVTPTWLNMNPQVVCIDGDYAYLACGCNGLFIYDISDPENPLFVKRVETPHEVKWVAVRGGYAYVTAEELLIVDVDPPASAQIVNTKSHSYSGNYITISGNYAYVSGGTKFSILDISDPLTPIIVTTVSGSSGMMSASIFGKITASGDYAYVGMRHSSGDIGGGGGTSYSFNIFDISTPESPHSVKSLDIGGYTRDIVVDGGYAYITTSDLAIIDIDPPGSPSIVGYASLPDNTTSLELAGNYAYVTDSESGLEIFDIQNPESPYLVNTVNTPGWAEDVALSGDVAIVADEGAGLQVIDIGDIGSSGIIGSVETIADANGADVSGDYAYVGGRNFQIVNIEDPENAYIVSKIETAGEIDVVKVEGGYAYVLCDEFQIIDIDPPELAYIVNTIDVGARQFTIGDGYAYTVEYGFNIIDIDPPESAHIVNTVDMPWRTYGVASGGGYAYVTARDSNDCDDGEMKIIDIDPPEAAHIVNSLTIEDGWPVGVALGADYAYIACNASKGSGGTIDIVNITTPESAFIYNAIGGCSPPYGIREAGGCIFAINGEDGIRVIDVVPPESPYNITTIETRDFANDVAVSGGYVYVSDKKGGLRIFQLI
jgi:hypothetical protein